jgi:hypothetical protein
VGQRTLRIKWTHSFKVPGFISFTLEPVKGFRFRV